LFEKAFGSGEITGERILKALAQFELTLVSANSRYDRVTAGKDTFTVQEKNGYELFLKHCNSCHTEPLFTSYQFENNGLKTDTILNDRDVQESAETRLTN
jgi:cytochrome c peroxidase